MSGYEIVFVCNKLTKSCTEADAASSTALAYQNIGVRDDDVKFLAVENARASSGVAVVQNNVQTGSCALCQFIFPSVQRRKRGDN